MNARVLEIFRSLQGEGKYVGVDQVFVRLFECNMHCVWCDTPHSIGDTTRRYKEYSEEELLRTIQELSAGCHSVSLTGGEPLLQADFLTQFIPLLHDVDLPVYLETNGTLAEALQKIIEHVDTIAMDIKLPSSTQCQAYWKEHEAFIKIGKEKDLFIKTVISSTTAQADIEKMVKLIIKSAPETTVYLQPNYFEMKNGVINKCQEFQKYCTLHLDDVRVLPQVHKFMKLR